MSNTLRKIASVGLSFTTAVWLSGAATLVPIAGAQSVADLQAQIAALLAQIQALQAQLAAAQGGAAVTSYNFTRDLTLGSRGDDVSALQRILISGGYLTGVSAPTGYFGPLTKAALAAWQAAKGISPAVGYFGPKTRAALAAAAPAAPAAPGAPVVVSVPAGYDLAVALASDNPPARTLGSGTAFNPALKLVFSAGSKEVKISSLTLTKSGFLANTRLNGVDVVDSKGVRHGNVVTSINADNSILITMASDPVVIAAGGSEVLTVRFNLLQGDYTGTVAFALSSAAGVGSNVSSVYGSFPLAGNAMNVVSGASALASTTLDVLTSTGSSTLNVDPNSWQEITRFRVRELSSNEGVYLRSLTLYNYGNAGDQDYRDVTLEDVAGKVLATAQPVGQYVRFSLGTPYLIDKGLTKDFVVRAKLVGGTSRTVQLVVYNNYDIELQGATTGVSVLPSAGSNDTSFPIGNGFNIQTIGSGSMTMNKAGDSPSAATTPGANGVVLAKYVVRATGEDAEIRQVDFGLDQDAGSTALTGTVYLKFDGVTVYSNAASNFNVNGTAIGGGSGVALSSYPVAKAGKDHYFTVEVSVNSTAASTDSYFVNNFDIVQIKRLITNDLVDPGVTATDGNAIAVKAAALAVTTLSTPVAGSVVVGTTGYEFATIRLDSSAGGEDVKVSKIVVDHVESGNLTEIANLLLYKDNDTSPLQTTASTASNADTVAFNFTTPLLVTRSAPVTLHLKADVVSGSNAHTYRVTSSSGAIVATGASTGNALNHGTDITYSGNGQAQTVVASGNLTVALVSGAGASPSEDQVVSVGTTDQVFFAFKLTSQYETQKITKIKLTATGTAANTLATTTLSNIRLYEGGASTPFATAAQFDSCDASKCTVTFNASDNLLSAPVPFTGVTIYVKANVAAGGVAKLGDSFKFTIPSSTDAFAIKGSVTGGTSGSITGTPQANGVTYVVPFNVAVSAISPLSPTQVGLSGGQELATLRITNNGSAAAYVSSTITLSCSCSGTSSVKFKLMASGLGGTSPESITYASDAGGATLNGSSSLPFAIGTVAEADRTLNGGTYRNLVVRSVGTAVNNDNAKLSIGALGNVVFTVKESELGYDGNLDGDQSDQIDNLRASGLPSFQTVTFKT